MTIEVTTAQANGIPVVSLRGFAGPDVMERLADGIAAIAEAAPAVVVDVDQLVLADPYAIRRFLSQLCRLSSAWVISCSRLTGRRLIRRCADTPVAVFASPDDAVASVAAMA